jgi:hypothetical protein
LKDLRLKTFFAQIVAYCVSALLSGAMFLMWRRMDEDDRQRLWRLYGWFCGLMFCGSCFGAVTWGVWMQGEVEFFSSISFTNDTSVVLQRSFNFHKAQSLRLSSVWNVTHAIEFLCLSVAQLLVLDRMTDFAFPQLGSSRKCALMGRWVSLIAVSAGNVAGLCGNAVASVKFAKASEYYNAASSSDLGSDSDSNVRLARSANQDAQRITSIQMFCETIVVLLILLAFAIVGAACVRRIKAALDINDATKAANADGKRLHLQIACTSIVVFLAFTFRSIFATMYAVVSVLQDSKNSCPQSDRDSPTFYCSVSCFNTHTHVWEWLQNTPELEMAVVIVSSPLCLLVSLWGMTSTRMLQLMLSSLKPDFRAKDVVSLQKAHLKEIRI